MYCSISSILFIIYKQQSVCLVYILITGLNIIHHMLKVAYVYHEPSTQCPALYISCFSGTKQLRLFLVPPLESPLDGMLVALISSRCSGNEPALLPRWQTRESS